MNYIRESVFSNQFYPSDLSSLNATLKPFFQLSAESVLTNIKGLILPHAGYIFSGQTTAYAIANLKPDIDIKNIIILGPCHQYPSRSASVWDKGKWITPFGNINIDEQTCANILDSELIDNDLNPHKYEHSIEVQLPFFQYYLKNEFSIIPIAIGNQDFDFCYKLGKHLSKFITDRTLIVASSDLYHGYDHNLCKEQDGKIINIIDKNNLTKLKKFLNENNKSSFGCGIGPIITLLSTLENISKEVNLTHSTNSAEVTGNNDGYIVGYASFVIS